MLQKPITTSRSNVELSLRPLTQEETHFYSFLRDHYKERVKALPHVRLLKSYLKSVENILERKAIFTLDN